MNELVKDTVTGFQDGPAAAKRADKPAQEAGKVNVQTQADKGGVDERKL